VVIAVVGAALQICVYIWRNEPLGWSGPTRFAIMAIAALLFLASGWMNFNRLAMNYFYRDRLAEAYLETNQPDHRAANALKPLRDASKIRLTDLHGRSAGGAPGDCVNPAPYHLVVTCLNLTDSGGRPRQATRKTDQFIFSKLFCGSESSGFLPTEQYRLGKTQLADAMTISGAAASPAMGQQTFFAQSLAMTLFNVRLGQWMENPSWAAGTDERRTFWPPYLVREIIASSDADSRLVYLSDGGHSGDNVGIYPLLKRRCRLIVALDAEQDQAYACKSLVEALRQIRIDEDIEVEIDLTPLRPRGAGGMSAAHYVIGRIVYRDAPDGWLIVLKSSLTGDEQETIANYRRGDATFPHQSTGDLFFDDAQFEAYRLLGEHMVDTVLDTDTSCREVLEPAPREAHTVRPREA